MDHRRYAMNYGGVLGLVLVLLSLLWYTLGLDDKESFTPSLINNGTIIVFITYGIIQYKNINQGGFISYGDSLKLGTTIAFFSAIIFAFYTFLFISYINPDALSDILSMTEQAMLESNPEISDEELDKVLEITAKFMQPHWILIMGMLSGTFMGFLYSLIISVFVKNPDPNKIA